MKNRGFGLTEMLAICVLFLFALIVSVIVFDRAFDKHTLPRGEETLLASYEELERKVQDAASDYAKRYYSDLREGSTVTVSARELQEENFLEELKSTDSITCSGYASFEIVGGELQTSPYIKCKSKYTTRGYQSNFDK